ncbi:DUF4249 domain-containing protein [Aquimarina sp. 2201CG5-10]|uniref:DUF4249 domain-containing protein n=1 Tax=Aquimarina callyspongiae TaxID=3098150 RepID=UPI002AB489B4|nr:DUF4249 domain-containing protein [Aquimarina sp. 2201CG5-10]MDY8138139.1 DUF4249 domain-containing protein [Aquimarina sp. 2201CG5-10]
MKNINQIFLLFIFILLCNSCVEEFEFSEQSFEDILVVESEITNELKFQEILISRTFRLEDKEPAPENNAIVTVIDDQQIEYQFSEITSGRYVSNVSFAAELGKTYRLQITTQNGNLYTSSEVSLPQQAQLDNVFAERVVNDSGVEGIGIFVDSSDPTGNADFYRYEFDETYQVVPPFWSEFDLEIVSREPPVLEIIPRSREERVCYINEVSNRIILNNTSTLSENNINRFMVQFIEPDNVVVRGRYSVLVRQYVQSEEAFRFFETIKDFSDSETLFSQVQPGFVNGNIVSMNNPEESVLGFFEVASVTSGRTFVNLEDFFPEVTRPEFQEECSIVSISGDQRSVIRRIDEGYRFFAFDPVNSEYSLTMPICTDCNVLGTNIRPDFWED